MPCVAQRDADRLADAAGAAGDDCNACHVSSPLVCYARGLIARGSQPSSSRPISAAQHRHARRAVVEAGQIGEIACRPRRGRCRGRGSPAPPASPGNRRRSPARRSRPASRPCPGSAGEHRVGRRLEPFGAAEARLEGDDQLAAQRLARAAARSSGNGNDRDRRARSVRCGMPWKLATIACGSKSSAASAGLDARLRARRYRPDRHDKAAACAPPAASACGADAAKASSLRGRGRRRAILRIERRDQDALAARRLQRVDPLGDRRAGRSASHDRRSRPAPNAPSSAFAWRAVIAASGEPSSVQTWR